MSAKVLTYEIKETRRGWLNLRSGRYYNTAAGALKAVQRDAKRIVESHGICISKIEWEPTTRVGRMVVEALQ